MKQNKLLQTGQSTCSLSSLDEGIPTPSSSDTPSLSSLGLPQGSTRKQCRLAQSGRSMVEMLGTLAIIGVLSIGGIAGYSYGMDKWRANEVINDVNMRMIDIAGQVFRNQSEIAIPEDWDIKGRSGYIIDVFQNTDSEPSIMVEKVPTSVCKMILQNSADTQDIYVGVLNGDQVDGNWYLGDNEHICEGSDKEMLFAMSPEILAGFNPDSEDYVEPEGTATIVMTDKECYSNADCRPDKPFCDNGTCVECTQDEHCPTDLPYCDTYYGQCVACLENSHCGGETPVCNTHQGTCVACVSNSDCEGKAIPLCDTNRGICDCPEGTKYDSNKNKCIECLTASECDKNEFCNSNYRCVSCDSAPSSVTYNTVEEAEDCASACDNSSLIRTRANKTCWTCQSTSYKNALNGTASAVCAAKCTNAGIAHDSYAEWCINCNGYVAWNTTANASQSCDRCRAKGVPCFSDSTIYYPCSISRTSFSSTAAATLCASRCAERFAYKTYCYYCSSTATYTYDTEADAQKCAASCTGTAKRVAVGLECRPASE